jgi:tetratricopeptide (TPR) repeat protein/TolB-like protein
MANGQFAAHPGRALEIAAEVAEGLARAHSQGIVHRDLKPSNVMLTEDGHAKIIDFGLAKLLRQLSGETADTITGGATDPAVVLGTVAYMAPEQARGGTIDHRTDIFSFGVLLYELFSGTLPFRGQSSVETMHAILHQPAPQLRFSAPLPATASQDVQRIVEKCLAKNPDDRYQGMKDLAVDLKAARRRLDTASFEVAAVPVAASKRPTSLLVAVASVALIVAAGLWLWLTQAPEPAQATGTRPSVAVLHFENNTGNTAMDWLRTGLTDMLVTDLSQSTDVEVLSTDRLVQILGEIGKLDDKVVSFETVQELARRAHVQHVLLGSFVKAGDAIRINVRLQEASSGRIVSTDRVEAPNEAGLFPTMDDLTRRVKAQFISSASSGGVFAGLLSRPGAAGPDMGLDRDLKDVTTSSMEAYRHYAAGIEQHQRGRYLDAIPHFEQAIKADPGFALAYAKLAVVSNNSGLSNDRDKYAERALQLVDRLTPRERYYIEGFYYSARPETTTRAIAAYEKVLELYPDHSASRNNVATLYARTDQFEKAVAQYDVLRARGFEFPGSAGNAAQSYLALGRNDQGLALMHDFVARFPNLEQGWFYLGGMQFTLNRLDEAEATLQKAIALRPDHGPSTVGLAVIRLLRDDFEGARQIGERMQAAKQISVRGLGTVPIIYSLIYAGRTREALAAIERAVVDQGQSGSNESASQRAVAAEVHLARGDRAAAAAEAERSLRDARGRLSIYDGMLIGSLAGSAVARKELQRIADALPVGSDKVMPDIVDAIVDIDAGRHDGAVERLQRALKQVPPGVMVAGAVVPIRQPRTAIAYWSGRAHLASGNPADAEREFAMVANAGYARLFSPFEYVRSLYYLGQLAERRNDPAAARDYYTRFLKHWKDGDIDRDKVEEALRKVQ